jgi:hypothetical protein
MRVRLATYLTFLELRREAIRDELDFNEAELLAQAEAEVLRNPLSDEAIAAFEEWKPTSTVEACPHDTLESVVHRAVLMLPGLLWLYGWLARQTKRRGHDAGRKCLAASFLFSAWGRVRPELWPIRISFIGYALRAWGWEYPEDDVRPTPGRNHFSPPIHRVLAPDVAIVQELMVETFMKVARQTRGLDRQGRPLLRHPKAGLALVGDGSFCEADVQQHKPPDNERGRSIMVGDGRDKVWYIVYGAFGRFRRRANGYRLVVLMDLATGLPVIAKLASNKEYEPDVILELLQRLFELEPNFPPVRYFLADRLHGHSKAHLRTLIFTAGITPVCPWRADYPDKEKRGVPHCNCTRKEVPMRVVSWTDRFWSQEARMESIRRQREGKLKKGQRVVGRWEACSLAEQQARLTYSCQHCKRRLTSPTGMRPWDDPRIYTYLPHTGDGHLAALRTGLGLRRNAIESLFAALQRLGVAGKGMERPAWAKDQEMEWFVLTALLFMTARRLVFENGLYAYALAEAVDLGLLDPLTLKRPDSGLGAIDLAQARARRLEVLITNEGALTTQMAGTSAHSTWPEAETAALPTPPRIWGRANNGKVFALPFGSMRSPDDPPDDDALA